MAEEKSLELGFELRQRMDHQQKNDMTETARELGRKTREEIVKGESNVSPEIPDRRRTSCRHLRPPCRGGDSEKAKGAAEGPSKARTRLCSDLSQLKLSR